MPARSWTIATTNTRSVDEIIAEMTRRIVEKLDPLQVSLFGSQARGDGLNRHRLDVSAYR
jgi:predicted nucleotidyltransferase